MADIAELGYKVDSREIESANRELNKNAQAAKRVSTATARMERDYVKAIKQARLLGIAVGALGLVLLNSIVRNTIEAERVQAQLAAALKSTAGASGQTIASLNQHAGALQRVTAYGDEAIGTAQGVLLTFTKIGGETFPKATEAVLDMATALQMDLKSASIQVGKALNDPILGVTALGRAGVQFSEDQKEMIRSLVETGDIAGAQAIILKELETQFGGSARAARDTLGGALQSLQNAFGDLLEGDSGSDGVRGAKEAIEELTSVMQDQQTKQAFSSMISLVASLTAEMVNGVAIFANYLTKAAEMRALATGETPLAGVDRGTLRDRQAQVGERIRELQGQGLVRQALGATPLGFLANAIGEDPGAERARLARGGYNPYTREGELEYLLNERTRLIREDTAGILREQAAATGGSSGSPNGRGRGFRGIPALSSAPATEESVATTDRQTASTRALEAAERALAEARRQQEQQQRVIDQATLDFTRTMEDLRAEMEGPLAQVQLDYSRREDELVRLAQLAGLSNEELASSLDILEQARLRDVEAVEAQIKAQQKWAEQLANQDLIRGMDDLRMSFEDNLAAVLTFQKSGKDALTDLADTFIAQIARMISQQASLSLFGAPGEMGGGSIGGFLGSILGAFGGGRAYGGNVRGDKFYEIGEGNRPELANIGGRQFLIPGNRGRVEPISEPMGRPTMARRGGDTFIIRGATSNRALERMRIDRDRAARRAQQELG